MNNKLRHTIRLAALPLLLAACQNDELPRPATPAGGSTIAFTIDAEMAETRSLPENPQTEEGKGAVQHVSGVRLYLFRHGDNGKTYFAGHEAVEDWNTLHIHEGKEGETVTKSYTLRTTLQPLTEYTLLGIGYEKEDTEGYANAYEEQYNNSLLSSLTADPAPGTSTGEDATQTVGAEVVLDEIVTTLQDDKGKAYIQHNEYFTGTVTARTDGNGLLPQGTLVEMRRRVAGLSACFELTGFVEEPKAVAIMLWKAQNKDVPTLKKIWQEPFFTDHGTDDDWETTTSDNPQDSPQCLLWIDKLTKTPGTESLRSEKDPGPDPEGDDDGSNGPGTDTDVSQSTCTYGKGSAYVLPQESAMYAANGDMEGYNAEGSTYALPQPAPAYNSEKNYTLAVVVYNEKNQAICTKRAALAVDGQLIFATDLGTGIVDDESYYRYPIVANRFYRFDRLELAFDPSNPFEIEVEKGWEGNPDLDFAD